MTHQELIDKAKIKLCPIGIKLIEEENPVSASRSGKNTVYHHCEVYQGRPSYASCLMVMDMVAEGTAHLRPDCELAIKSGNCPAVAMRKAELRAGRSLFYVDYERLTAKRREQWALDRETSPVQFRRNKTEKKFVPTTFSAEDIEQEKKQRKPEPVTVTTKSKDEDDYNTNIMEKVVKKVIDNDHDHN